MKQKLKCLQYAYPTSSFADSLGMKNGCYYILVGTDLFAVFDPSIKMKALEVFELLPNEIDGDSSFTRTSSAFEMNA
jgi:hypothetical protein